MKANGHDQLTPVCRCGSPSSPVPSSAVPPTVSHHHGPSAVLSWGRGGGVSRPRGTGLGNTSKLSRQADRKPPRALRHHLRGERGQGRPREPPSRRPLQKHGCPGLRAGEPAPFDSQGAPRSAAPPAGAGPGRAAANGAAGAGRAVQEHPGGDSPAPPSSRRAGARGEHGRGTALSSAPPPPALVGCVRRGRAVVPARPSPPSVR